MSAPRVTLAPVKQAVKAASRALVDAVGGIDPAEAYSRANRRRLSEYGLADNECFMPVDVIMDLEAVAHGTPRHPQVTRFLARQAGYALVALPKGEPPRSADLHRALAEAGREAGELVNCTIEALADGELSEREGAETERLADAAAEAVIRLKAMIRQLRGEAG